MADGGRIIPSTRSDFVELARTQSGRLFKKHILTKGPLIHPTTGETLQIDDEFIAALSRNFASGVNPIVQLPLADDENAHTEAPDRNLGEVTGLSVEGDKVYAMCDFRKSGEDVGKTLLGASAFLHTNYPDTNTGEKVGPTLLHVAVTNRPYVTHLEDYSEIVAASAPAAGEVVLLTPPQEKTMTKEELIAALKAEHGLDVEALQLSAAAPPAADLKVGESNAAIVKALTDAGILKLSAGQAPTDLAEKLTGQDVVNAVVEVAADNVKLSNSVTELRETMEAQRVERITEEVDEKVRLTHILPAKRDANLAQAVKDYEGWKSMVNDTPLVKLSHERGHSAPEEQPQDEIDAAIERYTAKGGAAQKGGYVRA